MSRVPTKRRRAWRLATGLALSGLALSACAATPEAVLHVTGQPSISISVPLRVAACTTSDTCFALGTTGDATTPTTTGEWRHARGTWSVLPVPEAPSATLDAASCWDHGCLAGGAGAAGDLVWRLSSDGGATNAAAPRGGRGVEAISCYGRGACTLVDSPGPSAAARWATTSDGGATWSAASPLGLAPGSVVTSLSCVDATTCLASVASSDSSTQVLVTRDGVTWTPRAIPATWRVVTSITCAGRRCVALVARRTDVRVAYSSNLGRSWSSVGAPRTVNALACTTSLRCALVGATPTRQALVARWRHGSVSAAVTRYVPSPFVDVACGTATCTAVAPSTVATIRP
jgi:hypothetical protein